MLTPAAEIRSGAGATGPAPAHVTVRGLCKRFGATTIYHDFDLDIPDRQEKPLVETAG